MGTKRQTNYDLDGRIVDIVQAERLGGVSGNKTIEAAVYWYVNHLGSHERELARMECQAWIETGVLPDPVVANELDLLLRAAKLQFVQSSAEKPKASGRRKRG